MPFPLLPRSGWQSGFVQTCASFFKSRGLVSLFVLESQRGQRKIAARRFPYSKMEVSLALHSIQCGSRGYPAKPMITREIKSLPHQLFDSGRKRKRLLPHVHSPSVRNARQKLPSPSTFLVRSCQIHNASLDSAVGSTSFSVAEELCLASRAGVQAELRKDRG